VVHRDNYERDTRVVLRDNRFGITPDAVVQEFL
jgi:hypothetical protein